MTDTLLIRETKNGLSFDISVNPHASRSQIAGISEGLLKVKVTAPPVEGAANDACIELLAKKLGLKKSRMKISAGARGRKKTILINDVSRTELEQKLRSLDLHPES